MSTPFFTVSDRDSRVQIALTTALGSFGASTPVEMKVTSLQGVSDSVKGLVTPVVDVEAVASSFSMCPEGELLSSPEGLRPVRTNLRQAEDCAKVTPCAHQTS